MSHNITVKGGSSVLLPTAGKCCDRDIIITAEGDSSTLDGVIDGSVTEITSNANSVRPYVLSEHENLMSVNLPLATSIGESAFTGNRNLPSIDLPSVRSIGEGAFSGCYKLKAVVLRSTKICTLANTDAFNNCYHILGKVNSTHNPTGAKDGYFYVPSALVEEYKVATNWTTFSSQFRALEDYTVDGTITGELDQSKI